MLPLEELETFLDTLTSEVEAYNEKPTKARSKRIRTMLGQVKSSTPSLRKKLVDADKAGY